MKCAIFAAIIGLASAASYAAPDAKTCDCYFKYRECQSGPDANQSFCVSQFTGCANSNAVTGKEYFDILQADCKVATTSAPGGYPTAPTYPAGKPDAKTCECYAKLGQCQTGPNANQATCGAEFASCSGNNPYTGDGGATAYFDNLKKNCPTSSAPAPSSTPTAPSKPDGRTCLCYAKLGQCQTAPSANQASCAAEFASCSGNNPYTGDSGATAYFDNLKKNCPTSSAPAPSSTPTAPGKPDAKVCACYDQANKCRVGPDANQSFCSAQFASCAGYNPYTGDDRATAYFDNLDKNCPAGGPTTPSSAPQPSGTPSGPTSTPDAKVCACYDQANKCRVGPDANMSFCSSQFASCAGYNPYTGDTAATTAYFDNLDKNCPTDGAPSGTSPVGTMPVAYPTAGNNHTIVTYTGAASHARVGAGALAAGIAAMLVL